MTRENAILCLKGIKNYGRDTFTEQSDWQESLDMAIKALEQEPCDDCVSRQAVLDEMYKRQKDGDAVTAGFIKKLPPVTPQQMTGHWIDGVCSECGWDAGQEAFSEDANFCMKCGVKMLPIGAEKE